MCQMETGMTTLFSRRLLLLLLLLQDPVLEAQFAEVCLSGTHVPSSSIMEARALPPAAAPLAAHAPVGIASMTVSVGAVPPTVAVVWPVVTPSIVVHDCFPMVS